LKRKFSFLETEFFLFRNGIFPFLKRNFSFFETEFFLFGNRDTTSTKKRAKRNFSFFETEFFLFLKRNFSFFVTETPRRQKGATTRIFYTFVTTDTTSAKNSAETIKAVGLLMAIVVPLQGSQPTTEHRNDGHGRRHARSKQGSKEEVAPADGEAPTCKPSWVRPGPTPSQPKVDAVGAGTCSWYRV